jgi:hypothetical protein
MGVPALAIAGFLCVLAVVSYALLRHVYLAGLTTVAPLCVLFALALPHAWRGPEMQLAMFFAPICTLLLFDRMSRSICSGETARAAFATALKDVGAAIGPILAAYILTLFVLGPETTPWTRRAGDAAAMVIAFGFSIALGGVAIGLRYPEDFIARANAARERRERLFGRLSGIAQPRWSLSVSGIALVLAAIAVFGIRGFHVEVGLRGAYGYAGSCVVLAALFAAITRNWRLTLAATLAAMLAVLPVLWMWARVAPDLFTRLDLWFVAVLELAAMSAFVSRMSQLVNQGESPASAILMTLRDRGPAAATALLVLVAAGVMGAALAGDLASGDFVTPIAGLAAALLFFPAFGNTIYWLLPRYRSVDEVFGKS